MFPLALSLAAMLLVPSSPQGKDDAKSLAAQWPSCPTVKGKAVYSVMVFGVDGEGTVNSTAGLIGDPAWLDEAVVEAKRVTMPQPLQGSYFGLFCTTDATPRLGYVFDQAVFRGTKPPARISPAVAQGNMDKRVEPKYPALARSRFVQGAVKVDVAVNPDGAVAAVVPVSGHPELFHAAVEAVRQWRFKPFVVSGKAIAVETVETLVFAVNR